MDILEHELVPKHEILGESEVEQLLASLHIERENLPKVLIKDPVVEAVHAKVGDVLKITRKSPTAGTAAYYRLVVD